MSVKILDTTLRDGEQRPGVSFTREAKVALSRDLDAWGIDVLEAGIPAMGPAELETLEAIHALNLRAEILVWNRLCDADVDLCLDARFPSLHLSVPVSDIMLRGKLGKDRAWVLAEVPRLVERAASRGARVSLGAEDASRADPAFVARVFSLAEQAGAQRVRYADTLGLLTPDRVTAALQEVVPLLRVELDFHGHDDFGLATANALAAARSGARVLSCSLGGLGERAGNASLEQVFAALTLLAHPQEAADPRLRTLVQLCRKAFDYGGVAIPAHQALVGSEVFSHQSGIHVDGLLKDGRTYESWPPEALGGARRLRVGKHSGLAALRHWAQGRGVTLPDTDGKRFLNRLRAVMAEQQGLDPEEEFLRFLEQRNVVP